MDNKKSNGMDLMGIKMEETTRVGKMENPMVKRTIEVNKKLQQY